MTVPFAERLAFFSRFLHSPRTVGSVTPSSSYLARRMMAPVPWAQVGALAELGAGTGVFTRAIAERCRHDATVLIFEQDPEMGAGLRSAFPGFQHRSDARQLGPAVRELGLSHLDCVISGLPLALFSAGERERIIEGVWDVLKPGGIYVQFQFSPQLLPALRRRFGKVRVSLEPLNLPPALVYTCQK